QASRRPRRAARLELHRRPRRPRSRAHARPVRGGRQRVGGQRADAALRLRSLDPGARRPVVPALLRRLGCARRAGNLAPAAGRRRRQRAGEHAGRRPGGGRAGARHDRVDDPLAELRVGSAGRRGDARRRVGGHVGPARRLPALRRRARRGDRRARPPLPPARRPARPARLDRPRPGLDAPGGARLRGRCRPDASRAHVGARARLSDDDHGLADDEPARLPLLAAAGLSDDVPPPLPLDPVMRKIPLLYGSRMVVASADDDAVVLAPPPPPDRPIADVGAAVRDALRFPLAGASLETIVPRDARATILVEAAGLPIPAANRTRDPRHAALVAAADELERLGVRSDHQTILVAAGLARRPSRRVVESLVTPEFALRFRGEVAVHDAEDDGLVEVGEHEGMPLKAHRAVAESDVVVVISAAVTVLHGGPAALLAASSADAIRSASAESLLEAHLAPGWQLALALERAVRRRTPLIGVSLALDLPRFAGTLRGYPYEAEAVERVARSRLARGFRFV